MSQALADAILRSEGRRPDGMPVLADDEGVEESGNETVVVSTAPPPPVSSGIFAKSSVERTGSESSSVSQVMAWKPVVAAFPEWIPQPLPVPEPSNPSKDIWVAVMLVGAAAVTVASSLVWWLSRMH